MKITKIKMESTNKSMFRTAADILEECDRKEQSETILKVKLKALKQMSACLDYELNRFKLVTDLGYYADLREIEIAEKVSG